MHALEATLTVSDALSRNLVVQLPIPPVDPASVSLSSGAAPDFPRREHWSATAGTAALEDWAWAYDVSASVVWVRVPSGPEATSVRLSAKCRPKAPVSPSARHIRNHMHFMPPSYDRARPAARASRPANER